MHHREYFDADDGDEVTYVDRKIDSASSQIPLADFNSSATRNKAVVIDDHMSFLLSDSLRGRKWKPDYADRGVVRGSDIIEESSILENEFYGHGLDFNPHQLRINQPSTEHQVDSRPHFTPVSGASPYSSNIAMEISSAKKSSRNAKDVAFDRPSHWRSSSTSLKPRIKKNITKDSNSITPNAAKSMRTTESRSKIHVEIPFTPAVSKNLDADSLQSLSFQPEWLKLQPSPTCVNRHDAVDREDAIDIVDDYPPQCAVKSPSEKHFTSFISPGRFVQVAQNMAMVSPNNDRPNSISNSKFRSQKGRSGSAGSIRAMLEKVSREMDCNEARLQTLLCPVGNEDQVSSGRRSGSWDLQDPRNRARCSLDAIILFIAEDRPPFHVFLARVLNVTLFSKNAKATLPRTIGEDNSLCNTVLEPEPEPEAIEQQQSRTEQDQSNAQHKAAIQAASPHLSDLVLVETHNVWLYMKPNLLRGVGKHLQVGRTIRVYDPISLQLDNHTEHEARFIILGTHCWEAL